MDTALLETLAFGHLNRLFEFNTREDRKKLSFVNISILKEFKIEVPDEVASSTLPFNLFSQFITARNPLSHDSKKSMRRLREALVKLVCTMTEARALMQNDTRNPEFILTDAANAFLDKACRYRIEAELHAGQRRIKEINPAAFISCCPYCIVTECCRLQLQEHIQTFHEGLLNYEEFLDERQYFTSTDDSE